MRYVTILGLAAALSASTAVAQAQQALPPNPPLSRQQFEQIRSQMAQIHSVERAQILNALTPAHKTLLANVVGRLAISVNPDFREAARELDAVLSASEKQQIISAAQTARNKARSLMPNMHPEFPMGPPHELRENRTPDAGRILLRLATPGPSDSTSARTRLPRAASCRGP